MLDGAARVGDLVKAAARDGQRAIGITDHGNMYGVLEFYKAALNEGIKPIIGTESYMAAESRHERPVRRGRIDDTGGDVEGGEKLYYHLTLLAESTRGYKNLMLLSSAAYLEGYYYKPRVDWELLERHHEGIIATTGCLGGVVLQALLAGDELEATRRASRLQDIFGRDNLFVEVQDHGIAAQRRTNPQLIELAKKIGAPLVATNDSHYTHRSDAEAHEALLCVQTGSRIDDPKRFKFEGTEHYLKTAAEMRHLFSDHEEACDSTLLIAERANVEIELGHPSLPEFPVPDRITGSTYEERAMAYLRELTLEGARKRYGDSLPADVSSRIEYELGVIADMGFGAYFLVVWDLIRFARDSNIRVGPGRGSAAGCCVAYCLGIVDLDPIRYDLLFERFLNPGRKQMPDIDMDFDERYRGDVIRYAAERYGSDRVAQIVTFSTIKARAAVRDAARVLGLPYSIGDRIAKAMPPLVMGRDTSLAACLEKTPGQEDGYAAAAELRSMYETDDDAKRVIDVAKGLEGLRRQDGIHAAAVVITKDPLTDYLPIQRKPDSGADPDDAPIVTQYEMHGVEELGLLKMDFLGLRTLSVIERALDVIERARGERPDIDSIPLDDDEVFAMLRAGDSMGIFQLEGRPMRSLMRSLAPTSFDDVAALVALYRPGPMAANMHNDYADRKNGRKPVSYLHADLEPILRDTQGLMIYQESVMRVAQKFAGYSLEEADNLRKACGKKDRELIAAEREKFVAGCVENGYGDSIGTQLFDIIEPFADYAFNKSHSYGYGLVAYQTAWLKAHYPVEYMAALLTSVKDDKDKTALYLSECRNLGIEVMVPDINESVAEFAPRLDTEGAGGIVFGLAAVRNVGEGLVERIVSERDANGKFADFYDFCRRVDPAVLNKRTLESLAKAGAFDSLGHPRKGLHISLETIVDRTLERRREHDLGIATLFSMIEPDGHPDDPPSGDAGKWEGTRPEIVDLEFDKSDKLAFEKEMLGLYVSDHPLFGIERALARETDCSLAELRDAAGASMSFSKDDQGGFVADGGIRSIGGVVTELKRQYTKKGDLMARFVLEDLHAAMEVFVFPRVMAECGAILENDAVVVVRGKLDLREDQPKIISMEIRRPNFDVKENEELRISLPLGVLTDDTLDRLKEILGDHPGGSQVLLHVGKKVLKLPSEFNVDSRNGLVGELKMLLGPGAIVV
ncbi:MAG: DNA polymerase III subunit alpha [Actinobacteria bacterium]|jgi:DNA polymerase-3 subunit alpha|nr:DNA polymerase III subunit alpha [Actinomycetota bacterium]MCL5445070.1 DNA polymerase III subunit alpha [Actinomycetota bacterium]